MQIILVSRHLKAARTITIMPRHLLAVLAVAAALVFSTSALFSWLSVHLRLPMVENLLVSLYGQESRKTQDYVSNNLNLMAGRLGELQAKVLQLDQLGDFCRQVAPVQHSDGPPSKRAKNSGAQLSVGTAPKISRKRASWAACAWA